MRSCEPLVKVCDHTTAQPRPWLSEDRNGGAQFLDSKATRVTAATSVSTCRWQFATTTISSWWRLDVAACW